MLTAIWSLTAPPITLHQRAINEDRLTSVERMVATPGGRQLRVGEAGDPKGRPVLMHHGMPGAGLLYAPHVADAKDRGIRLIG
jgi:hypothetical protein